MTESSFSLPNGNELPYVTGLASTELLRQSYLQVCGAESPRLQQELHSEH